MKSESDVVIYPAVFSYADDGITVTFPDLSGCISRGQSEAEAFYMARDALGCWLSANEAMENPIPEPSSISGIAAEENQRICMVDVWLPIYREKRIAGSVKKNVTIPTWLNALAEKAELNFSHVLQAGLKAELGIEVR